MDDGPEMLTTLARYLGDHGFEIETATSGKEALERFATSAARSS